MIILLYLHFVLYYYSLVLDPRHFNDIHMCSNLKANFAVKGGIILEEAWPGH